MAPVPSRKVNAYPTVPYFIIKLLQSLAASLVAGIMFYLIFHVTKGQGTMPWFYYFLQGAALFTLVSNIAVSIVQSCKGVSARRNAVLSALHLVLWSVAFGFLADAMKEIILDACDASLWGDDTNVCIMYKLLFAGAALSVLIAIAALLVDVIVIRKTSQYKPMATAVTSLQADHPYQAAWQHDSSYQPYGSPAAQQQQQPQYQQQPYQHQHQQPQHQHQQQHQPPQFSQPQYATYSAQPPYSPQQVQYSPQQTTQEVQTGYFPQQDAKHT